MLKKIETVTWGRLTSVPRPITGISEKKVKDLVAKWDPRALSLLVVNVRNGVYRVLDGNHELAAAMLLGFGSENVQVECYYDLTDEEESEIILKRQRDRRHYRQSDAFALRAKMGDPVALHIQQIVDAAGEKISDGLGSGEQSNYPTSGVLEQVYLKEGAGTLSSSISVLNSIPHWQADGTRWRSGMLPAVAQSLAEGMKQDKLEEKLNRVSSPGLLIGIATRKFHGYKLTGEKKSMKDCLYDEIKRQYKSRGIAPSN